MPPAPPSLLQVGPALASNKGYTITFNKVSMVLSFCFVINLAAMPLKAYLSEPYPWADRATSTISVAIGANETYATYQENCLAFYRSRYNDSTLPRDILYYFDAEQDVELLRQAIRVVPPSEFTFSGIPGALFYPTRARNWVREFSIGLRNASSVGVVPMMSVFGQPFTISGIWIETVNNTNTLYFAAQFSHSSRAWLITKFVYRCALTSLILWQLWRDYYRHYLKLHANLVELGTSKDKSDVPLEIVVGDPTALILQNTLVCVLFVVDFWCSVDIAGQCFVRLDQLQNMVVFGIASLYLSRTVWFAYLILNLTGRLLRRLHLERCIGQVAPTTVAIIVFVCAGPATLLQYHSGFFIEMYYFLFSLLAPSEDSVEDALSMTVYTLYLGSIPICYGLTKALVQRIQERRATTTVHVRPLTSYGSLSSSEFARFRFNDWKHRFFFYVFTKLSPQSLSTTYNGGTIYTIFETHQNFQRNAAFSFRGGDCYVLAHYADRVESYRLSLCGCINLRDPRITMACAANAAFGSVRLDDKAGTLLVTLGRDEAHWVL
ncbi:hypothetical protein ACHHYP_10293 [Achlya hypogyna]|uniref:Transmembrane protein n=1 Tax=Achlya hypogyna TaxID=1202772 RepID=A0A1V9YLV9_ACHHY|nr:hypothetical protein ACHHYP_10293 [Achlya hypogyna]